MSSQVQQPWWQPPDASHNTMYAQLPQSAKVQLGITGHQLPTQFNDWLKDDQYLDAYQAYAQMTGQHEPPSYDVPH
eukprot:12430813-Karenia_brevis.AAC.1